MTTRNILLLAGIMVLGTANETMGMQELEPLNGHPPQRIKPIFYHQAVFNQKTLPNPFGMSDRTITEIFRYGFINRLSRIKRPLIPKRVEVFNGTTKLCFINNNYKNLSTEAVIEYFGRFYLTFLKRIGKKVKKVTISGFDSRRDWSHWLKKFKKFCLQELTVPLSLEEELENLMPSLPKLCRGAPVTLEISTHIFERLLERGYDSLINNSRSKPFSLVIHKDRYGWPFKPLDIHKFLPALKMLSIPESPFFKFSWILNPESFQAFVESVKTIDNTSKTLTFMKDTFCDALQNFLNDAFNRLGLNFKSLDSLREEDPFESTLLNFMKQRRDLNVDDPDPLSKELFDQISVKRLEFMRVVVKNWGDFKKKCDTDEILGSNVFFQDSKKQIFERVISHMLKLRSPKNDDPDYQKKQKFLNDLNKRFVSVIKRSTLGPNPVVYLRIFLRGLLGLSDLSFSTEFYIRNIIEKIMPLATNRLLTKRKIPISDYDDFMKGSVSIKTKLSLCQKNVDSFNLLLEEGVIIRTRVAWRSPHDLKALKDAYQKRRTDPEAFPHVQISINSLFPLHKNGIAFQA